MDQDNLVRVMRRAAVEAGALIMEVYGRDDHGARAKSDASPVTEADEVADAHISAMLRAAFPDLALVTEEQSETHGSTGQDFLIVDPLDGTKEFIQRRGEFTVNIAWVSGGVPRLGVVYAPATGRLFYTTGAGSTVEEDGPHTPEAPGPVRPLSVSRPDNDALVIVASKSHRDAALEEYIGRYAVAESRAAGSSLKFCLVAAGEADFYPRLGPTMEWDTAAGHAVLAGAGGVVTTLDGAPLTYGKPGFRNPHFLAMAPGVELKDPA